LPTSHHSYGFNAHDVSMSHTLTSRPVIVT
jgi:hypothetical protein